MGVRQQAAGSQDLEATAEQARQCWCGSEDLEPLGSEYLRCGDCGTVVYRFRVDIAEYATSEDTGFYGDLEVLAVAAEQE